MRRKKEKKRKFVISLYAYASIINATSYLSKKTTAVNSSHLIISAESGKRKKRKRKNPGMPTHPSFPISQTRRSHEPKEIKKNVMYHPPPPLNVSSCLHLEDHRKRR
jgi:hypothetical protein